jgi:hypothetical protein
VVFPIRTFTKGNPIDVTCTIPIVCCAREVAFVGGEMPKTFEYEIYAPRSGLSAGTLTFTDRATKNYIWYVIEVHVDFPKPEQTITVATIARKVTTVQIQI